MATPEALEAIKLHTEAKQKLQDELDKAGIGITGPNSWTGWFREYKNTESSSYNAKEFGKSFEDVDSETSELYERFDDTTKDSVFQALEEYDAAEAYLSETILRVLPTTSRTRSALCRKVASPSGPQLPPRGPPRTAGPRAAVLHGVHGAHGGVRRSQLSQPVFKNSLFGCSGSGSAVLAIGSGSGFRVYPILDPSPTPKNPNPEIYPDEIFFKDFSVFRGGIA